MAIVEITLEIPLETLQVLERIGHALGIGPIGVAEKLIVESITEVQAVLNPDKPEPTT